MKIKSQRENFKVKREGEKIEVKRSDQELECEDEWEDEWEEEVIQEEEPGYRVEGDKIIEVEEEDNSEVYLGTRNDLKKN